MTTPSEFTSDASVSERVIRFGVFELDTKSQEIRKAGMRVRLSQQPLLLLCTLLQRPGEVFTREELKQRLWPSDVFVDFDHGLSKLIQKIRQALGDSADSPIYIETVQRTGYRFIAPVLPVAMVGATTPQTTAVPATLPDSSSAPMETTADIASPSRPLPSLVAKQETKFHGSFWLVSIVCAVLLAATALFASLRDRRQPGPIRSLAVLPLANLSNDPNDEYFADGLTDELITELAHLPNLRVVSRTSVMQDKGTHKPLQQIARELNVDAIVEGSVVRSRNKIRITAQLIDARDDKHMWAQSFEGNDADLVSLQDDIAQQIASQAQVALAVPLQVEGRARPAVSPAAHDAYLRGVYFLQKRDAKKSVEYFRQAISLEPTYAAAHAGLANALVSESALGMVEPLNILPEALASAKRAVELDPNSGEAYSALGMVQSIIEWDWKEAERNLQRGLTLSPSYSLGEFNYAAYLDSMNQPEEAVIHMKRALELDPLSFWVNRQLGSSLFFARRYDEALYYLGRAEEMEPDRKGVVENWISWIYEKKGLQDQAIQHDLATSPPGSDVERLRTIYRQDGWKAYWIARTAQQRGGSCSPYFTGVSYLRAGDRDQAFQWFNQAVDRHCLWASFLKVDPLLDDGRTDPRFGVLLHRVGLLDK